MVNAAGDDVGIPRLQDIFLTRDGEFDLAAGDVSGLFVHVLVRGDERPLFDIDFNDHHAFARRHSAAVEAGIMTT